MYIIRQKADARFFWNQERGWVRNPAAADRFSDVEKHWHSWHSCAPTPGDGEWVEYNPENERLAHRFTETELITLLEAADAALADADMFDELVDKLDLEDAELRRIRTKLHGIMDERV